MIHKMKNLRIFDVLEFFTPMDDYLCLHCVLLQCQVPIVRQTCFITGG